MRQSLFLWALFLPVLFLVITFSTIASGAECPNTVPLGIVRTGLVLPSYTAVDNDGRLFVSEIYKSRVRIYNYKGGLIQTLPIPYPLGIGFDNDGRIYIGNYNGSKLLQSGAVTVYDNNFSKLFQLGRGEGEFKKPIGIAVNDGKVYVADSTANTVRAYSVADGQLLFDIGGYGETPGLYAVPQAVAIDGATGDVYVAHRVLTTGVISEGAGISVYTKDGTFIRSFDRYIGQVMATYSLALDGSGRVYASDRASDFEKINVFDISGGLLCGFRDGGAPFRGVLGISYGKDGRIFAAEERNASVRVFGVDGYVRMGVSPSGLAFKAQKACSQSPAMQPVTISNEGPGILKWGIKSDSPWLIPAGNSGEINGVSSVEVGIGIDVSLLDAGTYTGNLTITSQGAKDTVSVSLEVLPPALLSVTPASLSFSARGKEIPSSQDISIEVAGGALCDSGWSAATDSSWISISQSVGLSSEPAHAQVSVNTSGLKGGTYNGNITITSAGAVGSPVTIPVDLTYVSGGTITVTTNTGAASFTLTGPSIYTGSGSSWTADMVSEGTYTIDFAGVSGFRKPLSFSLSVRDGETTGFIGNYIDLRRNKQIIATMGQGPQNTSDIHIHDRTGKQVAAFIPFSIKDYKYGASAASGDIDGDGKEEIVAGSSDTNKIGIIAGFKGDGTPLPALNFAVFESKYGANVALADFDGDGRTEIIAGAGDGPTVDAQVRILSFKAGIVADTGVNFLAYTGTYGVNIAAGDIDGDGTPELITSQGPDPNEKAVIRTWKINVSSGDGKWTAEPYTNFAVNAISSGSYGANISTGDLNADGIDEIIVSTGRDPSKKSANVGAFNANGDQLLMFTVENTTAGVTVAAGDTDFDGISEIVVGDGPASTNLARIRVYNADGTYKGIEFNSFNNKYGARVFLGQPAY